jgi:hypothetical protein
MSTSVIETLLEVPNSTPDERAVTLRGQIMPEKPAEAVEHRQTIDEVGNNISLEQFLMKKQCWESLEGKDAGLATPFSDAPAPKEKPIDIPSLLFKLSSMLPRDRQLDRRARKLAWQLSKGKRLDCDWDYVFLSELTPAEQRLSEVDFLNLYPDHVERPAKKGGRPRKYKTAKAQKRGHAERQRRYRERKLRLVSDVTKTPSQLAER